MYVVSTFNPTAATSGTFDMTVKQGGHIVVANESSANLILSFPNGASSYVPANDKRLYCISGQMAQPHTKITWTQQSLLPNANIVSQTVVEAYQPGENVPETYPSPLIRNTSVAGPITATKISLNVPIFVSGPGKTQIIEVFDTPGTGIRYITMDNFPSLDMYLTVGATSTPMILLGWVTDVPHNNITLNSDGLATFGESGAQAGRIDVYGNTFGPTSIDRGGNLIQYTGAKIVAQLIDASAVPSGAADLGFHVANTNNVVSTVGGVDMFRVNNAGPQLLTGTMQLLTNGISRISGFSGACTTTSTFFNHNLGAVPDLIALVPDGAASATGRTIEYEHATMTSTQVKVTGGASFNFRGIAIKF